MTSSSHASPSDSSAIGVDIGGTKIAVGVVSADGRIVAERRYLTPRAAEDAVALIASAVAQLRADHRITAVGIGAAGWLDGEVIVHSPNNSWRNVALRAMVADAVGLPVVLENDANAALWAEYVFGVGASHADEVGQSRARRESIVVMVAIGTGLGGGIIRDGALVRGSFGMAAEFGHTQMVPDGELCDCGARGCWEQYASGTALERFAQQAAKADPARARHLLGVAGGRIEGPEITKAAREGDEVALEAFAQVGHWLGVGLADLVFAWDPATIIVGGGVAETGGLVMEPALATYHELIALRGRPRPYAQVVTAELGNAAGLVGAADLARRAARAQ